MNYISTRGGTTAADHISGAAAIKQGLANDGGLFMPEMLPMVSMEEIVELSQKSYPERAAAILGKFLDDYYSKHIYESDPFAHVDQNGVGQLIQMAAANGRYYLIGNCDKYNDHDRRQSPAVPLIPAAKRILKHFTHARPPPFPDTFPCILRPFRGNSCFDP
jgi:hypothetical protein